MSDWTPEVERAALPALVGIPGVTIGEVCGVGDDGEPVVRWGAGQIAASARVAWAPNSPRWADCQGLRVILVFEDGQADRPIVLGFLDEPPKRSRSSQPAPRPKTLRVESEKELIIECGKAKIALRSDGRIEIRGGHLISRSSGPNKIKGGTVHIN